MTSGRPAAAGAAAARPAPRIDADAAPFWDALARRELVLERCSACDRRRFPPLVACPYCGATEARRERASGRGALYSWIVVHRAFSDAFAADAPYTVGTVELDEGCRVLARIEGADGRLAAGLRLRAAFRDHPHADATPAWTELYFTPQAEAAPHA
ncbi:MAG: OB-fold domain-containing protein [Myxococcales bacterium]|nr:OB-fold domain-containing protein [Myxococcales bacterium]